MSEEKVNSTLAQMNQILADKEAVIDKKKQELADYHKELAAFEAELVKKTSELKEAQEVLQLKEKEFHAFKESEERRIEERWSEIKEYEENLEKSMQEVLQEKLLLQSQSVGNLEQELEQEIGLSKKTESLNLNMLRESVGIQKVEPLKIEEVKSQDVPDEMLESEEIKVIPEMFNNIQAEVEKAFKMQKTFILEKTPERMCMQLGTRELRVFDKTPYPEIHLVVNYKNAKNDSKLQRTITSAARTTPDWIFETEQHQLVCKMFFKSDETPKNLIKKIKECIEKIEG